MARSRLRLRLPLAVSELSLGLVTEALVWAAIAFCPWASGGVPGWSLVAFAALAASAAIVALADAFSQRSRLAWSLGALALLVFTATTAAQVLPLPPAALRALAPSNYDLLQFTLGNHGSLDHWQPLTLDPPATRLALARQLSYLCLFLAAAHVSRTGGRRRLMAVIGAVGASVAFSVFLHQLFGLDALFGIEALHRDGIPSPFVNRNNHAALLELAACVQLGLLLRTTDRRISFAWGLAFLVTGAAVLLSGSRGGMVSMVAALVVFGALMATRGTGEGAILRRRLAVAGMLVVGVVSVAAYLNLDTIVERLSTISSVDRLGSNTKIKLWPSMVPLVKEHWQTGVGRDAFGETYPHYQHVDFDSSFQYPENLVLQITSDLGVPLGLLVLVLFAGAWATAARRSETSLAEVGLLAGIFALGLHDMGDFALELTGVAAPGVVALAALELRPGVRSNLPLGAAGALVAGCVALLPFGLSARFHTALHDEAQVMALVDKGQPDEVTRAAQAALVAHPADYVIQLAPAVELMRARPPRAQEALFWANRAMYLAPRLGWPHLVAGDALFKLGHPQQAQLEYKLAVEDLPSSAILSETLRANLHTARELADVAVQTSSGFGWMMDVASVNPQLELGIGQIALQRLNLEDPGILSRMSTACRNAGDSADALVFAQRLLKAAPNTPDAAIQVARGLQAVGKAEEAERVLRDGLAQSPRDFNLTLALSRLFAAENRPHQALEVLGSAGDGTREVRLMVIGEEIPLLESAGMVARELAELEEASRLDPNNPERQYQIARVLLKNGQPERALRSVEAGLTLDSGASLANHERWKAEVEAQVEAQARRHLLDEVNRPPADPER